MAEQQPQEIENINPVESVGDVDPSKPAVTKIAEEAKAEMDSLDIGAKGIIGKFAKSKLKAQMQSEEMTKANQLRLSFKASLAKLTEVSTKEIGMLELQKLINDNLTSQALRVYLGLIAEGYKNVNTNGKELYVLVLGYLAKAYKEDLLDPLDKPPSLLKTVTRMCEIVHRYLTENSTTVHHACALTLAKIHEQCGSDFTNDSFCSVFYTPLESLIRGGNNKMAQMGAAHCLYEFFSYLKQKGNNELLTLLLPKYLGLFLVIRFVIFNQLLILWRNAV